MMVRRAQRTAFRKRSSFTEREGEEICSNRVCDTYYARSRGRSKIASWGVGARRRITRVREWTQSLQLDGHDSMERSVEVSGTRSSIGLRNGLQSRLARQEGDG